MTGVGVHSAGNELGGAAGECADCGVMHSLPEAGARVYALEVMEEFRRLERLDYLVPDSQADPRLRFEYLFANRGNMFGVLECVDQRGETVYLRAFSSLAEGIRAIEGWVLPVLSASVYHDVILPAQDEIKRLTAELQKGLDSVSTSRVELEARRRGVSRDLWDQMCELYRFRNFRGDERGLREAVLPGTPITGGMGECCAPKLLQHAALNGLRPLSLAEFYWGSADALSEDPEDPEAMDGTTQSSVSSRHARRDRIRAEQGRRRSGSFYPSCAARCQPLLGFMLCGLDR